jgi:hypothetical protein
LGVVGAGALLDRLPSHESCDHQTIREFRSPNGTRTAIVIRTNCHATTPFVTSVAVQNDGEAFDLLRDRLFVVKDDNDIEVVWNGNFAMTIVHDKPSLIYTQVVVWRGEQISYRQR